MKDYIEERVLELAQYILENNSTVRKAAKKYNISKSTVHKDITELWRKSTHPLPKEFMEFWTKTRQSGI